VIAPSPTAATKESGTLAVNFFELTNVVVSDIEFHFTTDVPTNPVPNTVSVTPVAPGFALTGATRSIYGTGLFEAETLGAAKLPNDASIKTPIAANEKRRNDNGERYCGRVAGMDCFSSWVNLQCGIPREKPSAAWRAFLNRTHQT
jgi:hypothetical protein